MVFGCLYRSPTRSECSIENNKQLNSLIKSISLNKKYSHRCLVGDFNFPTVNWRNWTLPHIEESKEERFLDTLRDSFLYQHVTEPTRCRGTNTPSIIDLILSGDENQISNLEYLSPLGKSDHSVLSFSVKCCSERKAPTLRFTYNNADFISMKNHLSSTDWKKMFKDAADGMQVEDLWQIFKETILDLRKRFVPLKEIDNQFKGSIPIGKELQN